MASADSSSVSRFKGFKFSAISSKPPPLPPKDPVYLQRQQNRSQASLLSPELPPASPLSPSIQYAIRRANSPSPSPFSSAENNHMNYSSSSLVSPQQAQQQQPQPPQNSDGIASTNTNRQTQMSVASRKAMSFLKFPKRSPRTPPAHMMSSDDVDPPPPQEDDGISMPWNFQHNVHVDEGYGGIPPSWSTSLASAGFTDEEIAAIQTRRAAGARSPPDLRYLYTDRPNSPAVNGNFPFPSQTQAGPIPLQQSQSQPPSAFVSNHPYGNAIFSPPLQGVPILTHPTPRSTSLPRLVPESSGSSATTTRPPMPTLNKTGSTTSLTSLAKSTNRVAPPKRKPPMSPSTTEEESQRGHKPKQASSSTMAYSTDSHAMASSSYHNQTTTSFSNLNNSAAYNYVGASASTSNLSSTTRTEEDDGKTPVNVFGKDNGLEDGSKGANGTGSGLAIGKEPKEKKSLWSLAKSKSIKDLTAASASASTPNLNFFPSFNAASSSSHTRDPSINTSSHAHSNSLSNNTAETSGSSSSSSASHPTANPISPSVPAWKASASSLAAAGSNLAGGVVSKGSSFVGAMKSSAGRGVLKIRNVSGSVKDKEKGKGTGSNNASASGSANNSADAVNGVKSPTSDEEFISLDGAESLRGGKSGSRPAVWELYTRPRAASDASDNRPNLDGAVLDITTNTRFTTANANGSTHSLASSIASTSGNQAQQSTSNLRRQLSTAKSKSQTSLHSQRSQGSLRKAPSFGPLGQHHKRSGSVTSLDSIPETSPAPGAVLNKGASSRAGSRTRAGSQSRKGPASGSQAMGASLGAGSGANASSSSLSQSGVPLASGAGSSSTSAASTSFAASAPSSSFSQSQSTSTTSTPNASPQKPARPTAALPPRLSLQQGDSSDLSSWSEALLSGISLTGSGFSDEIGKGLGLDFGGFGSGSGSGSAPMSAPANGAGATMAFHQQQQQQHQKGPSMLGRGAQMPGHSKSQPSVTTLGGMGIGASSMSAVTSASASSSSNTSPTTGAGSSRPGRKAGQPLPSSKLPPRLPAPARPIPAINIANPNGIASSSSSLPLASQSKPQTMASKITTTNGRSRSNSRSGSGRDSPAPLTGTAEAASTARLMPVTPAPFSPMIAVSPSINKPLPSPLPIAPAQPSSTKAIPPQAEGMLSPPPSAWAGVTSPPGPGGVVSPAGSSIGPDSAQLWNEIEQMMDPKMISNIPGLHLSVALPPGAKEVLRSAGVGGFAQAKASGKLSPLPENPKEASVPGPEPKTVGDLVGWSPVHERFPERRGRQLREEEDDDDDDGSDYGDEEDDYDPYEGIIESAPPPPVEPLRAGRSRSREKKLGPNGRLLSVSRSREREDLMTVQERDHNRDSSRSSSSTLTITALAAPTIVRNASVARRVDAYVIDKSPTSVTSPAPPAERPVEAKHPPSPLSSHFGGSSEESGGSGSSGSPSLENPTPTTDGGISSPLFYYLDGAQSPSPTPDKMSFDQPPIPSRKLPGPNESSLDYESDYGDQDAGFPDEATMQALIAAGGGPTPSRPTIVISDAPSSLKPLTTAGTTPGTATPLSPFQRYRGWLSDVVAPLEEFIDEAVDPREHYLDLNEIAEGESGSVFAALLNTENANKLRLPPLIKAQDNDEIVHGRPRLVAIKSVAIVPSGSPKLVDLQREMSLMRGLWHENILGMDGVYVDLVEDSLWVRMELMERSLADIIGLVGDGLMLQDRMIARFASDVLLALDYLSKHNIAHRDVRSDNLLLNKHGVLKLGDFSNAVQVSSDEPMRSDIVGVAFWQAPEVRKPPYNALKVDVWSLGATVWEMAQTEPPFADTQQLADRWPPLRQPELYSPAFHDFLRKCSEPAASRPSSTDLLKSSFINNACGRAVIVQLLSQCMAIEKSLQEQNESS